ncbi:MAG: aldo/keto reductase [Micromonosporaceae bacterium]|nr:aldo/keto reductase [Micromonosporaceae bacterium]
MSIPTDTAALPSGARMPLVGLGTWRLSGDVATGCVEAALAAGYRMVDTATRYGNEREVGAAVRASGRPVFVTTKYRDSLSPSPRAALEQSLADLGLDRVDLWLIHNPPRGPVEPVWEEFLRARAEGLVCDIGVSNFSLDLLDEVTRVSGVAPAVNQIRWSPLVFDRAVLDGHRARGVQLAGYSGLRHGTLDHPVIRSIAERHRRSVPQIVVRWHVDHAVVTIPRSSDPHRIASNADVDDLALDPDDRRALDSISA